MSEHLESTKRALAGRYTIEQEIGAGGMGVVYLAKDIRLDRRVAIKTLPEPVARDPDWLKQFRREAKLLAALNHPYIATIHGLEESADGAFYIVLEWIEGETLARWLESGPMPLRESLVFCGQIAEALEAAHEAGIIHQDLKPGNVMLFRGKRIKVLDFGLARRVDGSLSNDELETITASIQSLNSSRVVGTPGYASPEQLRGEQLDQRTDLFAFGCVLYECLTGGRAFPGPTALEAIAASLEREPDWTRLPEETPEGIRELLKRCLAKDRAERVDGVQDLLVAIGCALDVRSEKKKPSTEEMVRQQRVHLPRDLTSFVGRERELEDCTALLGRARLVTLNGSGGCGKTRLAIRLAQGLKDSYPDGVWFVELAPVSDLSHVAQAVVSTMGLREEPGGDLSETLVDHLRSTRGLLLLDNCEHVLETVAALANKLLLETEFLSILTTSREPLGLASEQTYRVPSLALPEEEGAGLDAALQSEAVRLFAERAASVSPGFELTEELAPAVTEICWRLDGIPLAIELAAARIRVLSVDDIRARLGDRLRFLTSDARETIPRHQTLRAAIEWSYDQLTEIEQQLFRRLAVFSGGWTLEAATAVCGAERDDLEMLDLLTRLIDKSLVSMERSSGGDTRYRMLETLGQFALEKLRDRGEEEQFCNQHLEFFLRLGEAAGSKLMGAEQAAAVNELDGDHENLLAALRWCERLDDGSGKALRITAGIWRFWYARGYFAVAGEILSRTLAAEVSTAPSVEYAKTLSGAGLIAIQQGNFAAAETRYKQCLEISQAMDDELRMAAAYNGLGAVAGYGNGDYDSARRYFEQCLAIFRRIGDERGTAIALLNIGEAALRQEEFDSAIPLCEESLALRRGIRDIQGIAVTLSILALVLIRMGRESAARGYLTECLDLIREHSLRYRGVDALEVVVELAEAVGDSERSALLLATATAARESLGAPRPPEEAQQIRAAMARMEKNLGTERMQQIWQKGLEQSYDDAITRTLIWLKESPGNRA